MRKRNTVYKPLELRKGDVVYLWVDNIAAYVPKSYIEAHPDEYKQILSVWYEFSPKKIEENDNEA